MKVRGVQQARRIDTQQATMDQLQLYISQEGKRLNWQLAELEKRGLELSSFGYQNLVDKSANRSFLGVSKSGHMKISLSTRGKTRSELQQMASVIQKAVNSQTITPSGIKNYYSRVFDSLRARYPELNKYTDDELADIFTTTGFKSSKNFLGSDRIMQMIGAAKTAGDIKDYIEHTSGFDTITQAEKDFNKYKYVMDEKGNRKREYRYTGKVFTYVQTTPFDS